MLTRDDLVFHMIKEVYMPPLERLTVEVQLSRQKWAIIHDTYTAPIRYASSTGTPDFSRLKMGQLTFQCGGLKVNSPLWNTNQPNGPRGEQPEGWFIAHSAIVLNNGKAILHQ